MPNTVLKYLKEYGDYTFMEKPMNDVDSLALCQLCYLKFDGMVPDLSENKDFVSMRQVADHANYEHLFADERFARDNRALFEAMLESSRFGGMRMNFYVDIVETDRETQFSAITFLLEDQTVYIACRGTDETIVGWKEDFNMAFLFPVPGQELCLDYMCRVAERIPGTFYVGGHSKGGNLAVYAAMMCPGQIRERIRKVYSMDGPGFRPEIREKCGYEKIADRIVKILPHSSVIGMLFETDTRYRVVESRSFGLLQHDPYTWLVEGDHFVYVDDLYEIRRFTDGTINEWILSLNEEQLRTFVDTLYQVVSASKAENLIDFTADWHKNMNAVILALREVDEDTVRVLKAVVRALFDLGLERLKRQRAENGRFRPGGAHTGKIRPGEAHAGRVRPGGAHTARGQKRQAGDCRRFPPTGSVDSP